MNRSYPRGLGLLMALIIAGSPLSSRSDDTTTTSAPRELQKSEISRLNLTPITPVVRRAGYSSVADWQDTIADQCDELTHDDCDQPRRFGRHHCCGGRHMTYECYRIHDWFCYIRGYGPTVWDRHGQLWHPRDAYYVRYNNYWRYSHPEPWLEPYENRRHLARREGFAK